MRLLAERFLPLLVEGDTPAVEALLVPQASVSDPQAGPVATEVLTYFLVARYMWLAERQARVEAVRTIVSPFASGRRVVVEHALHLTLASGSIVLPIAVVGESEDVDGDGDGDGGERLARVRIYHSNVPLTGSHRYRGPLVKADETLRPGEPIASFLASREAGVELGTMTDDGAACALEYTVVRWGDHVLAPQPGLAVVERASGGALGAVRIYDDVRPPPR